MSYISGVTGEQLDAAVEMILAQYVQKFNNRIGPNITPQSGDYSADFISVKDTLNNFTGTTVEAVLAELKQLITDKVIDITSLYSGSLTGTGTINLTDNVSNYPIVVLLYEVTKTTTVKYNKATFHFPSLQSGKQMDLGHASGNSTATYVYACGKFNGTTFTMDDFKRSGFTAYSLYRIIGIKV